MKSSVRLLGLLSIIGLVGVSGCAVDATTTDSIGQASDELETPVVTLDPVRFPDGVKVLAITAHGAGCPENADSYAVDIAPDGQAFTVTFSQYEASIGVGEAEKTPECLLKVKVKMSQGLTYGVSSFSYGGFVYLEKAGMLASQQSTYRFDGDRLLTDRGKTTWRGPVDQDYLVTDDVGMANLVWKPCGLESSLKVRTRIRLRNNRAKDGQGYINTLAADGSFKFQLEFGHCH